MTNKPSKLGYIIVGIEDKNIRVSRIMASTFLINPDPKVYEVVNHINHITTDNNLSNLNFVTRCENSNKQNGTCSNKKPKDKSKLTNYIALDDLGNEVFRITKEKETNPDNYKLGEIVKSIADKRKYRGYYWKVKNIARIEKRIEKLKEEDKNLEQDKEEIQKKKQEIEEEIKNINTHTEELTKIITEYANANKDTQKQIDDLNFDITNLKISVSSFDESEASMDEIQERIQTEINNATRSIENKTRQIEEIAQDNFNLEKSIEETKEKIEKIKEEVKTSSSRIEELKQDRIEKNEKLQKQE